MIQVYQTRAVRWKIDVGDGKFLLNEKFAKSIHNPCTKRRKVFRGETVIIHRFFKDFSLLHEHLKFFVKYENLFGGFADVKNQRNGLFAQSFRDFGKYKKNEGLGLQNRG